METIVYYDDNLAPKRGKNHKTLYIVLTIIAAVLIITGLLFFLFFKMPRFENITYELGTEQSEEITYYMRGSSFALRNSVVDASDVDYMKVGTYTVYAWVRDKEYEFEVEIEDTTAPKIKMNQSWGDINIGFDFALDTFCASVSDLAGPVDVTLYQNGTECEAFHFSAIGTYKLKVVAEDINGNKSKKEFDITAVDTLAPEISALSEKRYYAVGDEYTLYDFVSDITDNSGDFEVYYLVNDSQSFPTTVFSEKAQYKIEVIASDAQNNISSYIVYADSDYKPELYGTDSKTVKINTEYNLLEGVFAWDNEEGFISERVNVVGDVDFATEGDYSIKYLVTDHNGLTKEVPSTITVAPKSYSTVMGYPDDLIEKMFEADAFQYELLTDDSEEDLATLMYPCQVAFHVKNKYKGSGFIYKIDEDYIYIGTAGHCIDKAMLNDGIIDMWVYNPTYDSKMTHKSVRFCLEGIHADDIYKLYSGTTEDRGMFKISRSQIPNYILVYLKEVNKTNELSVSKNNGIYTNTIYAAKDMYTSTFSKELHPLSHSGPDYDYLLNYFSGYKNENMWLITNEGTVAGQSGSLLYDKYGNPVAAVSGRASYASASIGRSILFSQFNELYNIMLERAE